MEKKKELLIKVIKKLEPHRNLADGIVALLETVPVDEKIIDGILDIIQKALVRSQKAESKKRLSKAHEIVKKIREQEENE